MASLMNQIDRQEQAARQPTAEPVVLSPKGQPVHRVWLLTNAPSPYQSELLSAISDRHDLDLEVRFLQSGSPAGRSSAERYPSRVLRSVLPRFLPAELQFHPQAIWECAVGRYDGFVLSGLYTSVTFLACALVLVLRRKPWAVWLERPRPDDRRTASWSPRWITSRPVRGVRKLIQRAVLSSTHRVLCIGTAAREAYRSRGVAQYRLDVLPYCCDIDRFGPVDEEDIAQVRDRYGLTGKLIFLTSAQMIDRKGIDVVIGAFAQAAAERPEIALLLIGDGPRRTDYEASVSEALCDRVRFAGHVPQADLPAIFRAADVFVLASRHDGWGVVINEACAAGLPIVTTRQTGAARDLVDHGRSGFVLERDDVEGFATAMSRLADDADMRRAFGLRSRELVGRFSPDRGAELFQRAVDAICR